MPAFRPPVWYAYCFISEFVLIYPTYLIMMESTGIDPVGVASLLMIWSVATLLFELPTGVLGDLFPRKHIMLLAGVLDALAFLCWLLWPEFWGFALGFVIWSLGGALASGTSDAYLYEVLDEPAAFARIYGRTEAAESVGVATALLLGGFAASFGFELVLLASVIAPLIGVSMLFLLLPHSPRREQRQTDGSATAFLSTLSSGLLTVARERVIALVILIAAALAAIAGVYEEYAGVLLAESSISLALIGVIYAGIWLARAAGAYLADQLGGRLLPLIAFSGASLALLLASGAGPWALSGALLVFFGTAAAVEVVYGAYLQHLLKDGVRATVTSIQSLATEALAAVLFVGAGFIAVDSSWLNAAWWMALVAVVWGLLATAVTIFLTRTRSDVE